MIIDFHTHVFPDEIAAKSIEQLSKVSGVKPATDGTVNGLLASMEKNGVDLSVIMPVVTRPSQFDAINTFAKNINEQHRGRLISFGGIHPDSPDYKAELRHIKELGLPGIKLHPDYQGVMIDDVRYMNIIEYANELGLIIMVHAGVDIGLPEPVHCPPDKARRVLDALKPEKLVLAHLGGWKQWDAVCEYLAGENVYLDTSFIFNEIEVEYFLDICQSHDKDKLLFGSDSPWGEAKADIDILKEFPFKQTTLKAILEDNAKKLLNIP